MRRDLHLPGLRRREFRIVAEIRTILAIRHVSSLRCADQLYPLFSRELRWIAGAKIVDATGPVPLAFAIGDNDGLPAIQLGVIARLQTKLAVGEIPLVVGSGYRIRFPRSELRLIARRESAPAILNILEMTRSAHFRQLSGR